MNIFNSHLYYYYEWLQHDEIRIIEASETEPLLFKSETDKYKNWKMDRANIDKTQRNYLMDLFVIMFSVSPWFGVTAIFNELPLIVPSAPEQWNLPSYLTCVVQLANIGPIVYGLMKKHCNSFVSNKYCIYTLLVLAAVSALLSAFYSDYTSIILNGRHSSALIVLTFFMALVGCTSSVLYLPYMGRYVEVYMVTFMIGEGLSGCLAATIALIQGVGQTICVNVTLDNGTTVLEPKTLPAVFSSQIYFLIEFAILACSCVAFFLMNNLQLCKDQLADQRTANYKRQQSSQINSEWENSSDTIQPLTTADFRWLCVYMAVVNLCGNGVMPSIQSYSALPYGSHTYHFTVTLSSMANPIACFFAFYLPRVSRRTFVLLTLITFALAVYLFAAALMSPQPLLVDTLIGSILMVTVSVFFSGCLSYIKLLVTLIFRNEITTDNNKNALYYCGAMSQIGSAIGAFIIFLAINLTNTFHQYDICQKQ